MDAPLSQQLLDDNRAVWDAMLAHRFVRDIEADTLPEPVFRRYLVYERAFVETAILIFGHLLVRAPGLARQRWLIGVLQALSEDQIGYFERAFAALGLAADASQADQPAAVADFREGMLGIARDGGYASGITAMLAAEWMYETWCTRAARCRLSQPEVRRWVDLHAAPAFAAQAAWLRAEVDGLAPTLTPGQRQELSAVFGHALTLEIAFHTAPYESAASA